MTPAAPTDPEIEPDGAAPSGFSWLVFEAKRRALRLKRRVEDFAGGAARYGPGQNPARFSHIAGQSTTALWSSPSETQFRFERGKVQNLRIAAAALDGIVIPAGGLFSFWRQVGPPTAARGFAEGRMLQQGCMVASVGGGLCQLSNSLFDAALQADCAIVERHAHSRIVPGSQAERGRDATVAWNYVDLRFRPPTAMQLRVCLGAETLDVTLSQETPPEPRISVLRLDAGPAPALASSCADCEKAACSRHESMAPWPS